jgi:hypothetical protein
MLPALPRFDRNVILVESGDQTGAVSAAASNVTRVAIPRANSIVQMSGLGVAEPVAMIAAWRPFGAIDTERGADESRRGSPTLPSRSPLRPTQESCDRLDDVAVPVR